MPVICIYSTHPHLWIQVMWTGLNPQMRGVLKCISRYKLY
eukprot:UN00384